MKLTERQKGFLWRAAELESQGMGIMAAPGFQEQMAAELAKMGFLKEGVWSAHEETGREGWSWRLTLPGLVASGYPYPVPSMGANTPPAGQA